ncbi:Hypothetical Protein OBI_RACECAR_250 [Arthrobacter phage Racecar]|nr:hypothetical protein PBI_RACECAR_42 [Arthrobacter phage Racecar]QFG12726.1 hypothetical protein PBI_MIMI_42 [Arthrobacter phage Mimi]
MARIEYHETPAGPHEFGDITTTIIMNEEEWDEFMNRPRRVCSNTLIELMKEKGKGK